MSWVLVALLAGACGAGDAPSDAMVDVAAVGADAAAGAGDGGALGGDAAAGTGDAAGATGDATAMAPEDLAGRDLAGRDLLPPPPPPDLSVVDGKAPPPDLVVVGKPDLYLGKADLAGPAADLASPAGDLASACGSDSDCQPPATICNGGACVPGCTKNPALCSNLQTCDGNTGRCVAKAGVCANDMDCGAAEYCTHAGQCVKLPTPTQAQSKCSGGTVVTSSCNQAKTVAQFTACAGPPSTANGCPYCRDKSCYWPLSWAGYPCKSDGDCHAGDHCNGGLCMVDTANPCPKTVSIADVMAGKYGSGKEVCIQDVVVQVTSETDGDNHVRMGNVHYPNQTFNGFVTEPTPQYTGQGKLAIPAKGVTVKCHGQVRWDEGHGWWELHPVDWFGP